MNDLIYYEPFSGQFFECSISDIVEFVEWENSRYIRTEEERPLIEFMEDFCERFCEPIYIDKREVPYEYFKLVKFVDIQLILLRLEGGVEYQLVHWIS